MKWEELINGKSNAKQEKKDNRGSGHGAGAFGLIL